MPHHLIYKSKAKLSKKEQQIKISHENTLLTNKMKQIDSRKNHNITQRRPCLESPSAFSLNSSILAKKSELIMKQNEVAF
jgi:hypothetical protein